jgi:hypothetical protein
MQLPPEHVQKVLSGLPQPVIDALKTFGPRVILAGGFIRAAVADEKPSDIDLFVKDPATAHELAGYLSEAFRTEGFHTSYNALTIRRESGIPIQIIYRWHYDTPRAVVEDFDFTIARAALWWGWDGSGCEHLDFGWLSDSDPQFIEDVTDRRLRYCAPERIEAHAGSLFRVFKFYKRGYAISLEQLAAVMARACRNLQKQDFDVGEIQIAGVLFSTLKEAGQRLPAPPKQGVETPDDFGTSSTAVAQGFSAGS